MSDEPGYADGRGDGLDPAGLWRRCRAAGIGRRRFFELLGAGGAAAVLAACGEGGEGGAGDGGGETASSGRARPWVKNPDPFIRHPTNLETRLESIQGFLTPNELFFVRNHAPTPVLDRDGYMLRVEGDGIPTPLALDYTELLEMPSRSVVSYLECAGNWRSFWDRVLDRPAAGGQWGTGAVGCATWTGVPLAHILERAGVGDDAVDVNLVGLDEGNFSRPMPIERARAPDVILAYAMNGDVLPPDHGFPIRAVVPGWVASNSVKWLGRIEVATERIWVRNNTTSYVLVGEEWPESEYAPAGGGPITTQSIKSALALPWPARFDAGSYHLHGFAHSPHAAITRGEWSDDEGASWRPARLTGPAIEGAWHRFELAWEATPGSHTIRTRATDAAGNTQPDSVPYNEKGYLLNIPLPHPIEVA